MSSELKVGEKEQVAVVIPCLDEATTIGKVVSDFRRVLPDAEILVVDNRSDDGTAEEAAKHGARVVFEGRRGNPVVWSARFFSELMAVTGDAGGRYLLGEEADSVIDVELGEAVGLDVDTPEALAAAGGAAGTGHPENA